MISKWTISFLFLYLGIQGFGYGQTGYSVAHYTANNGLPQNSIKSIVADSEGFIWLATEDGLARFDGRAFRVYNGLNRKISNNRMIHIYRGRKEITLPESGRNKISYAYFLEGENLKIENGNATIDTIRGTTWHKNINTLGRDPRQILAATGFPSVIGLKSSPLGYLIQARDGDTDFYICDEETISYYENWRKKQVMRFHSDSRWNFFSVGNRLRYLNTNGSVTTIFDGKADTAPLSGDILADPSYEKTKHQVELYWNSSAGQAFIYHKRNLYILEGQKEGALVTRLVVGDFDLNERDIQQVYFDKFSRKVFFGSRTTGLFVLTRQQFRTINGNNDPENIFYAHIPYDSNSVLTGAGFIAGFDPVTKKNITGKIPIAGRLHLGDQRGLFRDKNGDVWIKSGHSLFWLDNKGILLRRQWKFDYEIRTLHLGENGQVWWSADQQGLYRVKPEIQDAQAEQVMANTKVNITCIESLNRNQLLIGKAAGLFLFDIARKKLTLVQGTESLYIKSIHVSGNNRIWFTALDKGLMLLDKGRLISFPLDKNKYLASPHCVVDDGQGYFWVPTNRGLFQMCIRDLLAYAASENAKPGNKRRPGTVAVHPEIFYLYHAMDEGFNTDEFNGSCQPCAAKLANGYISLPSLSGLVWYNPKQINNYFPDGNIVLDEIDVNQKPLPFSGDSVSFPLRPEQVALHFSTAYFGNDYNLNLSYALVKKISETKSAAWIPVDNKDFTVRYSSLASGKYVLLIRKQDGFGLNHFSLKKIYLEIPPLWYETLWARSFFVLILAAAIYLFVVYRLKETEKEKVNLENIILQRTDSLKDTLKRLEVSNTKMEEQVHVMSRLLASISHDIQSPLRYITFAISDIPQMLEAGEFKEVSKLSVMLSDLSDRTGHMLRDLLSYTKVQVYGSRMYFEEINLKSLIDNKMKIFQSVNARNNNRVINVLSDTVNVFSDYQLLSIIIHNLLDNAAKCTLRGEIRIYSRVTDNHETELIISNSKVGLADEIIEMLNSDVPIGERGHPIKEKAAGIGLLIVKEISDLIKVRIRVSQTDVTSFHLFFSQDV